jgi:aryl-alcohol dehydrogenase-like predicted oxidoreductase
MNYRDLGKTGFEVSEVGYGAWGIGKDAWVGAEDGGLGDDLQADGGRRGEVECTDS